MCSKSFIALESQKEFHESVATYYKEVFSISSDIEPLRHKVNFFIQNNKSYPITLRNFCNPSESLKRHLRRVPSWHRFRLNERALPSTPVKKEPDSVTLSWRLLIQVHRWIVDSAFWQSERPKGGPSKCQMRYTKAI